RVLFRSTPTTRRSRSAPAARRPRGTRAARRPLGDPAPPPDLWAASVTRLQYCAEYVLLVSKPPEAGGQPRFFDNSVHSEDAWGYCSRLPGTELSRARIHAFGARFLGRLHKPVRAFRHPSGALSTQ